MPSLDLFTLLSLAAWIAVAAFILVVAIILALAVHNEEINIHLPKRANRDNHIDQY